MTQRIPAPDELVSSDEAFEDLLSRGNNRKYLTPADVLEIIENRIVAGRPILPEDDPRSRGYRATPPPVELPEESEEPKKKKKGKTRSFLDKLGEIAGTVGEAYTRGRLGMRSMREMREHEEDRDLKRRANEAQIKRLEAETQMIPERQSVRQMEAEARLAKVKLIASRDPLERSMLEAKIGKLEADIEAANARTGLTQAQTETENALRPGRTAKLGAETTATRQRGNAATQNAATAAKRAATHARGVEAGVEIAIARGRRGQMGGSIPFRPEQESTIRGAGQEKPKREMPPPEWLAWAKKNPKPAKEKLKAAGWSDKEIADALGR